MSILALYTSLFAFKWARRAGQVLMVIVVLTTIFMLVVTFTAAVPLYAYWDFRVPRDQVYMPPQSYWWASTGMHMSEFFPLYFSRFSPSTSFLSRVMLITE